MLKVGAIVATPFLLVALFLGATGILLVDVREGGADGTHIVIPVPLVLAQAALAFAPAEARYVKCEDFAQYQEIAVRLAEELSRCPDFIIAEVVERRRVGAGAQGGQVHHRRREGWGRAGALPRAAQVGGADAGLLRR